MPRGGGWVKKVDSPPCHTKTEFDVLPKKKTARPDGAKTNTGRSEEQSAIEVLRSGPGYNGET